MPTSHSSSDGFAETVHRFTYDPGSEVAAVIARAFETLRGRAEERAAERAKVEAERNAEERRHDRQFRRWLKAREHLVTAVQAVDRALAPEGMALGLFDEWAWPTYLAVAQVQLTITGRPTDALLEIAVSSDLRQRAQVTAGEAPILDIKMPTAKAASPADYITVLMNYLDSALLERDRRHPRTCRRCGLGLV